MLWKVRVPEWELQESGRVLAVGDEVSSWLTFQEVAGRTPPDGQVNAIHGVARPLPTWLGGEPGPQPTQITLGGGTLYWDAPESVAGLLDVAGTIETNTVDAPEGFPETTGVARRVRMEWQDFVMGPRGFWQSVSGRTRYEDVTETYFPVSEERDLDPDVEEELGRRAREAYDREVSAGRLNRGDSFEVTLKVPPPARGIPSGTTETRWTGVLIDLEVADSSEE